jgi:hypothetical protein
MCFAGEARGFGFSFPLQHQDGIWIVTKHTAAIHIGVGPQSQPCDSLGAILFDLSARDLQELISARSQFPPTRYEDIVDSHKGGLDQVSQQQLCLHASSGRPCYRARPLDAFLGSSTSCFCGVCGLRPPCAREQLGTVGVGGPRGFVVGDTVARAFSGCRSGSGAGVARSNPKFDISSHPKVDIPPAARTPHSTFLSQRRPQDRHLSDTRSPHPTFSHTPTLTFSCGSKIVARKSGHKRTNVSDLRAYEPQNGYSLG